MQRVTIAGMIKVELPGHTARLIDGGALTIGGEAYAMRDPLLGVLDGFEALSEGVGDEAPMAMLRFLPPDTASAAVLNDAGVAGSRVRLWTVEINPTTGLVIGDPEQQADWIVDYPALTIGMGKRIYELACVSGGERLFAVNRGNVLSPAYHKALHPGETGLDNASGTEVTVAWAAPSQARGVSAGTPSSMPIYTPTSGTIAN